MEQTEKIFSLEKSLMLNIIYDTLEKLAIPVESSNSERGIIELKAEKDQQIILKINEVTDGVCLSVTVSDGEDHTAFIDAFFDEINSTLEKTILNQA